MTVEIALIGAGRIGQIHAAGIAAVPDARLAALVEPFPEAAKAITDAFDVPVRTVDDVLADDAIDAVFITSPTDTHADLIELGARSGKAVFCEKPIDLSIDRTRACLAVVEETSTQLMLGFNRRFDPNFRAVRDQIDAGAIGEVEMVTIISRDPAPPPQTYLERSGGLFRDMTIHDFDMARFLLPDEPAAVAAVGSVLLDERARELGDVDSAAVTLVTASGRIAQITNSRRATFGYDQRIEVLGSEGMARAENLHESTLEIARADGYSRPPLLNFFMHRYVDAYRAELAAFVDAVRSGTAPDPSGVDGLRALLLAEAAERSVVGGRLVTVGEVGP